MALVDEMQILIPLAGLIDKEAESKRLSKSIEKLEKSLQGLQGRLKNPAFLEKAPQKVLDQVHAQEAEQTEQLKQLSIQLEKIKNMN